MAASRSAGPRQQTKPSCHRFAANQVRLWRFILAHNVDNFLRSLALPAPVREWSLRSVQVKLTKMAGRLVRNARWLVFQLAQVAAPRALFRTMLEC